MSVDSLSRVSLQLRTCFSASENPRFVELFGALNDTLWGLEDYQSFRSLDLEYEWQSPDDEIQTYQVRAQNLLEYEKCRNEAFVLIFRGRKGSNNYYEVINDIISGKIDCNGYEWFYIPVLKSWREVLRFVENAFPNEASWSRVKQVVLEGVKNMPSGC